MTHGAKWHNRDDGSAGDLLPGGRGDRWAGFLNVLFTNNSGLKCPGLLGGAKSRVSNKYSVFEGLPFQKHFYILILKQAKRTNWQLPLLLNEPSSHQLSLFQREQQIQLTSTPKAYTWHPAQPRLNFRDSFPSLEPPGISTEPVTRSLPAG